MFFQVFYFYAWLVATTKLKKHKTYFYESVNVKFSPFHEGEKGN